MSLLMMVTIMLSLLPSYPDYRTGQAQHSARILRSVRYDPAFAFEERPVKVHLTDRQLAKIMRPVKGKGGFQTLLRRIQKNVNGNVLTATEADIEKLIHYSFDYGQGGFQEQAKEAADGGTG